MGRLWSCPRGLGLLPPPAETIAIDAEAIDRWSRRRLARVFGYVPQAQLGLFPFAVRDVVLMGRTAHIDLFATPSARDIEIVEEMLDLLGIVHLSDQPYTRSAVVSDKLPCRPGARSGAQNSRHG